MNMDDVVLTGNFLSFSLSLDLSSHVDVAYLAFVSSEIHIRLAAHRNDNLAASLRLLCNELKAKAPQSERKRKKGSTRKEDKASSSNAVRITNL